jgi:hypothetical protein
MGDEVGVAPPGEGAGPGPIGDEPGVANEAVATPSWLAVTVLGEVDIESWRD